MPRRRAGLSAHEMVAAALAGSGRSRFSDYSFSRSLETLVDACNHEARLSPFGTHAARLDLLRCLKNLLRFDALEAQCPEVLTRRISSPVFITGMPRSGTTFLHNLIVQDATVAAPRLFQLMFPDSAMSGARTAVRKLWVGAQLSIFRLLTPRLNELHPIAVSAPEECTDITAQVFHSLRFENTYRVPSYQTWVRRIGHVDAYRFHRRFLQHLDARQPGRRWVLKSPDHVFALDDLRHVYPDARLVFLHRDPVRVLASVATLTEALRRPFTHHIDRLEIGREVSAAWLDGAQRMSRLANGETPILHLHYRDVVGKPYETAKRLYQFCDLPLTPAASVDMWNWLGAQGRAGPQRRYDLEDYGLNAHSLRERFRPYTERFDIELES